MDKHMQSIDLFLTFSQAPINVNIYMRPHKVPRGFKIPVLQHLSELFTKLCMLVKNKYGTKYSGITWFDFLKDVLANRGW